MSQGNDDNFDRYLKGDSTISELYQRGRQEGPPAALDQKILARAQQAVEEDLSPPLRRRRPAWLVPLSVAATVVLGVNLAFNLRDFRQDTVYEQSNGLVYSDSERSPDEQNSPHTAETPLANSPAASAPAQLKKASRAASSQPTAAVTQTQETGPNRLRMPKPETGEQSQLIPVAVPGTSGRPSIRSNTPGTIPAAPDDLEPHGDFAPPPPTEADQAVTRESAVRLEEQVAQMPRREQRIAQPASVTGTHEASEAGAAYEEKDELGLARLRSLQTTAQTGAAGGDAPERQSMPGSKNPVAITDFDDNRNRDGDEAAKRADESGDLRSADYASPLPAPPAVYWCDLQTLQITEDVISRTRREALGAVPPLTARTWILEIQRLAREEAYADACRQLAAYIATFGRTDATAQLSVKIPE